MVVDRCYGCMEEHAVYPCPRCGYTPANGTLQYVLRPGTILAGKYLVGKVLGQGGFGITYIGWDLQLERKVAIKEYFPTGHVSRQTSTGTILWYSSEAAQAALHNGQEMFLKEARKMSKVSEIEQTVRIFNVFQENGTAYICMDFIEGHTLKDRLKQTGPLSWEQTKKLFLPVMEAMEQVHKVGLIHRDLSPDNLMLQPNGGVKILDLGAAKDLKLNSGHSSMQVAKSGFSPLEQYVERGNSGTWTDVYALAATMYYTLTGMIPPSAVDRVDRDTLNWNLPQLQALPPASLAAMKRAMALRSGDRTQTMAAFAGELMQTKPPTKTENTKNNEKTDSAKPKKKWLIPALAAAVLAVSVFVGIGMNSGKALPEKTPGTPQSSGQMASEWKEKVDTLIETCDLEIYGYQNGSRMEMYYNEQGRECLRIFVNTKGQDEFIFLAEYDSRGNIQGRYGFENQNLMRATTWTRNADGNATEIVTRDGSGGLVTMTEIAYDAQGREISRCTKDADDNITLQATSTYDASGAEIYSGTRQGGEQFMYTYNTQGEILEALTMDAQGIQMYHSVYRYDSDGKLTEYLSYDANEVLDYREEYQYTGDLQTGEITYSFYEGTEYVTKYELIYGPGNVLFARKDLDEEYGSIYEYVDAMGDVWQLRGFNTGTGMSTNTTVSSYNWDGDYLGSETYDARGKLSYKTENHFDESGQMIGSGSTFYYEDGSYEVSQMDASYNTLESQTYNAAGELIEETEHHYDASGMELGMTRTAYESDGSYTEEEMDTSYHTLVSRSYDAAGKLVSLTENSYDSSGMWAGSVSTYYYYDGSYMVTEKNSDYQVVSQKTYDAAGNLVESA